MQASLWQLVAESLKQAKIKAACRQRFIVLAIPERSQSIRPRRHTGAFALDPLQNLVRQLTVRGLRAAGGSIVRQAGAIPYTVVKNQVVFLIVTSRGTGRWIFPKGELTEGQEAWETAALEALEEAGVEGEIESEPIGSYQTTKSLAIRRTIIEVEMYPLRVTRQLDQWQEMKNRHRHWVILPEAKRLLSEPRLAGLAQSLSRHVLAQPQPAKKLISQ